MKRPFNFILSVTHVRIQNTSSWKSRLLYLALSKYLLKTHMQWVSGISLILFPMQGWEKTGATVSSILQTGVGKALPNDIC